jgi:hypothetical protein
MTEESKARLDKLCWPTFSLLMEVEKQDIRDLMAENERLRAENARWQSLEAAIGDSR